jgi:hypothetical protein
VLEPYSAKGSPLLAKGSAEGGADADGAEAPAGAPGATYGASRESSTAALGFEKSFCVGEAVCSPHANNKSRVLSTLILHVTLQLKFDIPVFD